VEDVEAVLTNVKSIVSNSFLFREVEMIGVDGAGAGGCYAELHGGMFSERCGIEGDGEWGDGTYAIE
jgi:hypothetical protein